MATVADQKLLEETGEGQLVYQQHKTLSAASSKRDVVFRRKYEEQGNTIFAYAASEANPLMPENKQFARATLILHGIRIEQLNDKLSRVTLVSCLDFGGWIHEKFLEQEVSRVALRLIKIKQQFHA
eukprot:TRINITY_DN972_c0_g1_i1.p1 TRINITY_DN972_c0_g1~~TRINITY_DN972_c0_g1_i1.p1  ORF type:complete len:126 (-),score=26.72 TRINITY_DN972_c0_g1_i1:23-400(-)